MFIFYIVILITLGLIGGSFLGALTYRLPRGVSIKKGRSFCPRCHAKISWYDNIPLLSFVFLGGRCRSCKKRISFRYPAIELGTGITFLLIGLSYKYLNCATYVQGPTLIGTPAACFWWQQFEKLGGVGFLIIPFSLILLTFAILIAVFVIDLEEQIIPDNLVFCILIGYLFFLAIFPNDYIYLNLFSSFGAALFLLLLHLVTNGRGMGLGDVKLALVGGIILGWPDTLIWMFLSFLIGALVGVILILVGKAKLKVPIPFGPFLAFSLVVTFFWGQFLLKWFKLV